MVSASYARPCLVLHHLMLPVSGHTLAAGTDRPTLVVHNASAALHTAVSRAEVGKESSCEEEGTSGSTELSKDLLVHLRQTLRCLARGR